jgi:uncharacterized YigZ family protein
MRKEYLTVSGEATAELEEKKSRFIATVKPVITEDEAHAFINSQRARYWNASHNVYAYYICSDTNMQKFSDDGEPSGTAGLPVLEAIKKLGVQDAAVVITRYFGGTLLGASGLVRAYGKCATMGIEAAGIVKRLLCIEAGIALDYSLLGKVQAIIASQGYKIKDTVYAQDVDIYVYIPADEFDVFSALLTETTSARAFAYAGEKTYITVEA